MDTSMKVRAIAVGVVWAIWGIVCILWDIDPAELGDSVMGGLFHLVWGVATLAAVFFGGWWFLEEGADKLGDWYDERNPREGG